MTRFHDLTTTHSIYACFPDRVPQLLLRQLVMPMQASPLNLDEPIHLRSTTAKTLIELFGWMYVFSKVPYNACSAK
jgi:hypothetical protein